MSIFKIYDLIKQFKDSEQASVAVMAALSIPVLILLAAIGIEASRVNYTEALLQQAVDASAIAGARYNPDDAVENARKIFDANFPAGTMNVFPDPIITYDEEEGILHVEAREDMPTIIGRFVGINSLSVDGVAEAKRVTSGLELAMVLDVSASMGWNGRIVAMRDASKALVDVLYNGEESRENISIGMVPYSVNVNIGTNNTTWLSDPASLSKFPTSKPWEGCVKVNDTSEFGEENIDTAPSGQLWPLYFTESTLPDPKDSTARDNDWKLNKKGGGGGGPGPNPGQGDGKASGNDSFSIENPVIEGPPGFERSIVGPNRTCVYPMMPLFNSSSRLKQVIDTYEPVYNGGTFHSLGMIWGARLLSPDWTGKWNVKQADGGAISGVPIKEYGAPENVKAMILMTDGKNLWYDNSVFAPDTGDPTAYGTAVDDRFKPGKLGASNMEDFTTKLNQKLGRICTDVKNKGVEVFTVSFLVDDPATITALQDCATDEKHYAAAGSNGDLVSVFEEIGRKLLRVYIVR